jgi:hypothetical protein
MQVGFDPQDGLPRVASSSWEQHLAPALDPETLVCMEDTSQYVARDAGGRIVATFAQAEVSDGPKGGKAVARATLLSRLEQPTSALRFALGYLLDSDKSMVAVEPIRPKCRYYARQIIDFPGEAGHIMVRRFCRANRTDEGEYESVREALVYACELRDPLDVLTEKKIHEFDAERIRLGRVRKAESRTSFDVSAELKKAEELRAQTFHPRTDDSESADPADLAQGGIFNPK